MFLPGNESVEGDALTAAYHAWSVRPCTRSTLHPTFDDPTLIRDILVTLLFGGRDNTQNALAWGLYAPHGQY